jgi:hypothetical protein
MSFLAWITGRLTQERQSPHVQQAIRESEELLETKRRLITFTNDLDAGRLGGNQKVLHLRPNVLERAYLGTRQEGDRDT